MRQDYASRLRQLLLLIRPVQTLFGEQETTESNRFLVNFASGIGIGATIVFSIAFIGQGFSYPQRYALYPVVSFSSLIAIYLIKRNKIQPANLLIVSTVFCATTNTLSQANMILGVDFSGLLLVVFLATLLLTGHTVLLTLLTTICTTIILLIIHPTETLLSDMLVAVGALIFAAAIPVYILRHISGLTDRLREQQEALHHQNITLKETQQSLEKRTNELIEANTVLATNETHLQAILSSVPDLLLTVHASGQIIDGLNQQDWPPGYPRILLRGRYITEVLPEPLSRQGLNALTHVFESQDVQLMEVQLTPDDQTDVFTYELRLSPIDDSHALVMVRDITLQRRMETALQNSQKIESIGLLAGGIAHDFNNLLLSITAQASVAAAKLPQDSPAQKHLGRILTSSQRAGTLTQKLLAYAGRGQTEIKEISINQLIEENIELLKPVFSADTSFKMELDPQLPLMLGDAAQMQQVIMNLVLNAAEATENNGGDVSIRTTTYEVDSPQNVIGQPIIPLSKHITGDYICLEVTDTGAGIPTNQLNQIFDPFFTTKNSGNGLGLSATLGIVRAHGGALHVDSQIGEGSAFFVFLPAHNHIKSAEPAEDELPINFSHINHVLVTDDEGSVREAICDMVEMLELTPIPAANGKEAISIYQTHRHKIGLAIIDVRMPEMDGPTAIKHLWQISPQLPIILCSGFTQDIIERDLTDQPHIRFLSKPFNIEELRKHIQQLSRLTVE